MIWHNTSLESYLIIVTTDRIDLGSLSAGSYGYNGYGIIVPSGYKTTSMCTVRKYHNGGHTPSLLITASATPNQTSSMGDYYAYYAPLSIDGEADFDICVACVRAL